MLPFNRLNANFLFKRQSYHANTLTVFRDFNILFWWILLERSEPYHDAFLYEKVLKTDIYAVRFTLTALFSFKKRNFKQYGLRFIQKRSHFHFEDSRGTVGAYEINKSKR